MIVRNEEQKKNGRLAGQMLSNTLQELAAMVAPGVTTAELDIAAEKSIRAQGAVPAFLNYQGSSAYPYPAALCASVNDEVVHSIPHEDSILKMGDIISLDLGLSYKGFFVDSALTVCVGACNTDDRKLMNATREALAAALKVIHAGAHVGDIGAAVEAIAKKYGIAVVEELGGHATGGAVHEKPYISNVGTPGTGEVLPEGLVIAIEPIFTLGKPDIVLDEDEWTYRTVDGSRAAHFEQTAIVTKVGCEVLTPL